MSCLNTMITWILLLLLGLILEGQTLRMKTPNGGENLELNSEYLITWEEANLTGTGIVLHLFKGRTQLGTIKRGITLGTRVYNWKVVELDGGTVTPGSDYKVRARLMGTSIGDFSDSFFTISGASGPNQDGLEITMPHSSGDNRWQLGSMHRVRWRNPGPGQVKLELVQNERVQGEIYRGANNGTWQWLINNYLNGDPIRNGSYQLRITHLVNPGNTHQVNLSLIPERVDLDLLVSDISKDSSGHLTAWVRNRGNVSINRDIGFRIWENEAQKPEEILRVNTPPYGNSGMLVFNHRVQQSTCGTNIQLLVDCFGNVSESDENNNSLLKKIFFDTYRVELLPHILVGRSGNHNSVMAIRTRMDQSVRVVPAMATNIVKRSPTGGGMVTMDYLAITIPMTFKLKNCGSVTDIRDAWIKMGRVNYSATIFYEKRNLTIQSGSIHELHVSPTFKVIPTGDNVIIPIQIWGGYRTDRREQNYVISEGYLFLNLRFMGFESHYFD